MGLDEMGVDEVRVDEMGSRRSGTTPTQVLEFLNKCPKRTKSPSILLKLKFL